MHPQRERVIRLIEFDQVGLSFGQTKVLHNLSLQVDQGSVVSLIGASGSGKTTTLRLINGLIQPDSGQVIYNGEPLNYSRIQQLRRHMGYSVQGSGLFPHMTVRQNLSMVALLEGWSDDKCLKRCNELLEMVNMSSGDFLNKYPAQLSGGQRQRIGVARSLFLHPKVVLMDEPFGALDPITRSEIQDEVMRIWGELKFTIVLVTHDLQEAFKMSNRLILLNQGRVEQMAPPYEFISQPASPYVDEFLRANSPGKVLKDIKLYSVLQKDIWTIKKNDSVATHMQSGQQLEASKVTARYKFLLDESGKFVAMLDRDERVDAPVLKHRDHFLTGINQLLNSPHEALPIVDEEGRIEGALNNQAMRALD